MRRTLEANDLSAEIVESIMSIVGECELALYAGAGASDASKRNSLYDRTVDAILAVEEGLEGPVE